MASSISKDYRSRLEAATLLTTAQVMSMTSDVLRSTSTPGGLSESDHSLPMSTNGDAVSVTVANAKGFGTEAPAFVAECPACCCITACGAGTAFNPVVRPLPPFTTGAACSERKRIFAALCAFASGALGRTAGPGTCAGSRSACRMEEEEG